jgi:uncharacterized membrane protein YedE/YeeE
MDMTIVKFFFAAILTGMVGIHILHITGLAMPAILPIILGTNIIGGLTFGIGWSLIGYCPATSLGALGEGRVDAFWGILGMLSGAAFFAESYPALKDTVFTWGRMGAITLPQLLGINDWLVIAGFVIAGVLLFFWIEKKGL